MVVVVILEMISGCGGSFIKYALKDWRASVISGAVGISEISNRKYHAPRLQYSVL